MTVNKYIQKFGKILGLYFTLALTAVAQDASFTASVDRNKIAMGEQIEITFTLNGSSGGSNFRPPSFTDFQTLSGPNQSTNMQFINGAMSASVSYSYIVQPRSEGKFVVGPAFINYNGKQLQTQPITIEVTKGAPQTKTQPQSKQSQQDTDISKQIGDNLFLKVSIDKSRVFQGEQITATYKIYTRVNIANYNLSKMPSLTGFWSEELDVPKQVQLSTEVFNGKQYRVGILKKVALFPQKSGTLTIDPMEIECVVQVQGRRRSNDLFDQFFNDPFFGGVSNVNHKVRNQPVAITVLPLPSDNVPAGFSGGVGKFSMETWLDKSQTKTNEPVTLKVKISGRGNLKLLDAPMVNVSTDIEKYDPKNSDNITKQGDQITGSRTFEFLLIPRHPGEHKIPSFPYTYFDIEKKNYITLKSPEFTIAVEKGSDIQSTYAAGVSKEDVKLLGEDIRFIKSGNITIHRKGETFTGSALFFILVISPIFGFIGFLIFLKRREKITGNIVLVRNRKAQKIARKRLTDAKKFLDGKKKEEFYTEISRALWGYIADKLGISPSDLSIDLVRSSLENKKINVELIAKLSSTIEMCEFARFAPSADAVQMDQVYKETVELISTIEEQLR
ncbi:MAG: protein BatD [Ignavibacteriales bacterium]|nr:protein BatD [Ignavibacteriales bacterium]